MEKVEMSSSSAPRVPDHHRHNFYNGIHKALRLAHCRMLSALGSNDFNDQDKTARLLAELRGVLALGKGHLDGENREIHTALEQRAPGASARAAADHDDHEKSFAELEGLIRAVEQAPRSLRLQAGQALYRRYAIFAAHDFEHMNEEETELLATLQSLFTDEELRAIEHRIVSAIPPQKMAAAMTLMFPAMNHGERVEMAAKLQQAMPEPLFKGFLNDTIKPALSASDYAAVIGELMLRAA
jgi:hemerythrin-like domain-containing protein